MKKEDIPLKKTYFGQSANGMHVSADMLQQNCFQLCGISVFQEKLALNMRKMNATKKLPFFQRQLFPFRWKIYLKLSLKEKTISKSIYH